MPTEVQCIFKNDDKVKRCRAKKCKLEEVRQKRHSSSDNLSRISRKTSGISSDNVSTDTSKGRENGDGFSLNCTFDDGFCDWKQDDSDDFDWAKQKDESYIYIETSHQFPKEDKNAKIISHKQKPGPFCLTFLYKMYGTYTGALNVYMRTDDESNYLIFAKQNNMGNLGWQKAVIGENSNADFQIIIEGYISGGLHGGIDIDDISMTFKFCSVVSDCNFNSGLCNWVQDNDDFNCTWRRGNTPSFSIGPSTDHTSGNGNYIYIGTSKANASLISPLMKEGKYCFSFWYHMSGKNTGTLIVKKAEQQKKTTELFDISESEEAKWIKRTIFIQSGTYFKVIIDGSVVLPFQGYIAVDDVDITSCQDCENPLKSNGRTNSSTFEYGSVIEVTCNLGYHLKGPSTLTCISGGIWSAPVTCEPIDCENPQPSNGSTNSSNFRYGSAVEIMCHSGYYLIGPSILICQLGGIWSANVTCDPIECKDPTPKNGILNSTIFRDGSAIEITCNDGYKISGKSIISCQENGNWTSSPMCMHIDCLIPKIANGMMSGPRNNTTYNQTVDIVCEDGYDLIGNKSITCQADGNWSAPPLCDYHETTNTSSLTAVYVTVPLVAVALDIALIAIIWRKKIKSYFTKRSSLEQNVKEQPQPSIVFTNMTYSEYLYENQSYPEGNLSQDDANAETENGRHETEQDRNPNYSTIPDAEITTIKEIEHIYNHTSQSGAPVIDSTYSHLSKCKGMSSAYDTTTFSLSGNPSFQFSTNRKSKTYDFLKKPKEGSRLELRPNMQDEQDSEYDTVQASRTFPTYIGDYAYVSVGADLSKPKLKHDREDNE